MLQTGNGKGNEDDKGGDEFEGDGSDDYLEDDDNDDDEDDDLVESEYEISDGVSGSGVIPIIEVKDKGKTKNIKAEDILSMVLFITGPWLKKVLQSKKLIVIRILDHRHKSLISKLLPTMILYIFFFL